MNKPIRIILASIVFLILFLFVIWVFSKATNPEVQDMNMRFIFVLAMFLIIGYFSLYMFDLIPQKEVKLG